MKIIVLCGLIALTVQSANALELKVGDRIPAVSGEAIIVGNDVGSNVGRRFWILARFAASTGGHKIGCL